MACVFHRAAIKTSHKAVESVLSPASGLTPRLYDWSVSSEHLGSLLPVTLPNVHDFNCFISTLNSKFVV